MPRLFHEPKPTEQRIKRVSYNTAVALDEATYTDLVNICRDANCTVSSMLRVALVNHINAIKKAAK